METVDKPTAHLLCNLLAEYGVRNVVISPGSRCAPLTVALYRSNKYKLTPIIDERSAAFVALGMALRSDAPVAIVCTSGSAVLNYAPALAEAYYRRVPLIAISADRPYNLIDQRDGQTIRQADVLNNIVRTSIDIRDENSESYLNYANRKINEALTEAIGNIPGPVHINMQFNAPLTPINDIQTVDFGHKINKIGHCVVPNLSQTIGLIPPTAKILVVAGTMHPSDKLKKILEVNNNKWLLFAEIQSNLSALPQEIIINYIAENTPDIVISIGGDLVSASLKSLLRSLRKIRHISVGCDDNFVDTFGALTDIVNCRPEIFFEELGSYLKSNPTWSRLIGNTSVACDHEVTDNLFSRLSKAFPDADFHFSNGMAIRYAQKMRGLKRVDCNRGVSGIEGSTSTAIGAALVADNTTVLVTGDMSAAYDVAALAIHEIPPAFKMVVLDNNGGGIFRVIQTTKNLPERERFFAMPPRFPLKELAKAYGFTYFETSFENPDIDEFVNCKTAPAIINVKLEEDNYKML
ncbi:MAG: 2-succinyl-5-enolpyruvyl-6-hydroxy-3-cyclohexene-1-carboxylic-acid synthase [Muribaculaceae bacterium]|nr:2-succinyl-5-enolpyruvyl-6-hydroxy-3-cyclohexene-1-carboxylic-acid synthase [Muribaculaceae bacterium]